MNKSLKLILAGLFLFSVVSSNVFASQCTIAKELAKASFKVFKTNKKKGLAGLIQAHKMCPENPKIYFNLGVAYYLYGRPDLAYKIWAKLGQKKKDLKLYKNLAHLALKLKRLNEANRWADKALEAHKDKELVKLKILLLFRKGKYQDALDFAIKHNAGSKITEKAAEYLTEVLWNKFRMGEKEGAMKRLIELTHKYPSVSYFANAKDRMVLAMLDDSQIPLPKPLPDREFQAQLAYSSPIATSDESLNILSLKPTLRPQNKAYALIIGIRKYKHIKGPRFADNDAKNVYEVLVKRCGFKDDRSHIHVLLNEDATVGNIYNEINWLVRRGKLHPDAKIFFYFSGHGSPVVEGEKIKDGLLVPYDVTLDGLNDRTAVPLSYLQEQLSSLKNKEVVAMLDACFSGTGKSISPMKLITPKVNVSLLSSNKLFISAAAANRPAREYAPGRDGAFTYFFLKALIGEGDKNKDGWVDTLEAYQFAKQKLKALDFDQRPEITRPVRLKLAKVE